ncbi:hypothetical protein ES319_A13G209400v1 [Gossypium barbadense]|uniref:RNase H type-1 domain-containing protein n=1 Tax=Gossypium barbadense TaxID=3634 RepID=A0A5J5T2G4_GOSBA|nr:hypothetical protein ES319_A13G209400v1 [Gossypium barbadense]
MKRLGHMIEVAMEKGFWELLLLSQDLLPFYKADDRGVDCLKQVLDTFCHYSDHRVNRLMTQVFFSRNVSDEVSSRLSSKLGFTKVGNLGKYLGVLFFHNKLASRLTLVKSVLVMILNYFMTTVRIPMLVCYEIDKLASSYFSTPLAQYYIGNEPIQVSLRVCDIINTNGSWDVDWLHSVLSCDIVEQILGCHPPMEAVDIRWAKVNVDGSISMVRSKAALGGAIRGPIGGWLVEVRVMLEGLKIAWARGFHQVEMESDNALLVDILRNGLAGTNSVVEVRMIHT